MKTEPRTLDKKEAMAHIKKFEMDLELLEMDSRHLRNKVDFYRKHVEAEPDAAAAAHAREALAHVAPKPENSDTSGASVAASDTSPDPKAARLAPEVCSDEIRGLVEWVNGLEIREARELRRIWEARAEHAALLRVAEAAESVNEAPGMPALWDRLTDALAELRQARNRGSDGSG